MNIFYLQPNSQTPLAQAPSQQPGTLRNNDSGEAQMMPHMWGGMPAGPVVTYTPAEKKLDTNQLAEEYERRLQEVFGIIKSKTATADGSIAVDKVTVKLGVDAGGKIGWFVEGHFNVAFAFEVEFKIGKEK